MANLRVQIPFHLQTLGGAPAEVTVDVPVTPTPRSVVAALEEKYPGLKGMVIDPHTGKRRPLVRFYVCQQDWTFESADKSKPAKFFLMSCPAHQAFPTTLVRRDEANPVKLGSQATANQRTIYQYIHPKGIKSAQLVMGFTELAEGSVWNTMPPHTHSRRTEIYFYFDIAENQIVSHFLGAPSSTRHVFVHNEQAVLSPAWSIHCGCGTAAYKFIWAMAGENQTFDDMDKVGPLELR